MFILVCLMAALPAFAKPQMNVDELAASLAHAGLSVDAVTAVAKEAKAPFKFVKVSTGEKSAIEVELTFPRNSRLTRMTADGKLTGWTSPGHDQNTNTYYPTKKWTEGNTDVVCSVATSEMFLNDGTKVSPPLKCTLAKH